MKKTLLLTLVTLLFAACNNTPQYTINGNCGGSNDTLYLFGLDNRYDKIDKIVCDEEGAFSHTIGITRSTPLILATPNGNTIPLYAEPETEATLARNELKENEWVVKGGREQELYDSIANILKRLNSNSERVVHIDNFIKKYPFSHTNIEIIRRFMVNVPNPNNGFIRKRINSLGGTLQDHEYFTDLEKTLDSKSNSVHKLLPNFSYTTAKGKKITQKSYKEKLLIVNFWASWDSVSQAMLKEQSRIYSKNDTSKVAMLNISLDYDTALWNKNIIKDNIAGDNVCDSKAWDNEIVNKFSVTSLPYTLLVSPYQRIDISGISNKDLKSATDSLVNKYFNKNKK